MAALARYILMLQGNLHHNGAHFRLEEFNVEGGALIYIHPGHFPKNTSEETSCLLP